MGRFKMWQIIPAALGIIILSGVIIVILGSTNFRSGFNANVQEIFSADISQKGIITEADLNGLPEPVQRYFHYTGVTGKEKISTIRLKQAGVIRQTPEDQWKNIEAVEYYTVNPPAYVWMGQMATGPLSIFAARDSYSNGYGRMFIKMLGIKTIGDVRGEAMDHSALVRYLNEMIWFPTAFLNNNISWEAIDSKSAKLR
jgi:hypothetical protein